MKNKTPTIGKLGIYIIFATAIVLILSNFFMFEVYQKGNKKNQIN